MYVDTFEKTMALGGFSEEFLCQAAAANKRRADIAAAKALMHSRSMPKWMMEMVLDGADKHGVSPTLVAGRSARRPVVRARNEVIYGVKAKNPMLSAPRIAKWFGRDHTSILYTLAKHARDNDLPSFSRYDIAKRHASTAAFRAKERQRWLDRHKGPE